MFPDSQRVPGQTGCDVVAASLLLPWDDVTTGLWLGWRGCCVPLSSLWLTWDISLGLGWRVPACCHPTLAWCPWCGCCYRGSCSCSSSLRVLPVVLPYGRLRHAVLPQGRTTDGMPGLPPRLRIPVCLHGRGAQPGCCCPQLGVGLPGQRVQRGWVHWGVCVCVCGTAQLGLCVAFAKVLDDLSGACSKLVSPETLHKPHTALRGGEQPPQPHQCPICLAP